MEARAMVRVGFVSGVGGRVWRVKIREVGVRSRAPWPLRGSGSAKVQNVLWRVKGRDGRGGGRR